MGDDTGLRLWHHTAMWVMLSVSIAAIRAMDVTLSPAVAAALPAVRDAVRLALSRHDALTGAPAA